MSKRKLGLSRVKNLNTVDRFFSTQAEEDSAEESDGQSVIDLTNQTDTESDSESTVDLTTPVLRRQDTNVYQAPKSRSPLQGGKHKRWFCTQWVDGKTKKGDDLPTTKHVEDVIIPRLVRNTLFVMFVKEIGSVSEKPHFHFYIEMKDRVTKNKMIGMTDKTCDCEVAEGTYAQSVVYFEKTGAPIMRFGQEPVMNNHSYKRNKIEEMTAKFLANGMKIETMTNGEILQYGAKLQQFRQIKLRLEDLPDLDGDLKERNMYLYGPSGVGKSLYGHELVRACPEGYVSNLAAKWRDPEVPSKAAVLFDDLGPEHKAEMGYLLKKYGDRYAFPVEYKGGMTTIRPSFTVITSNYTLEKFCGDNVELLEALSRRFKVVKFKKELSDSVMGRHGLPLVSQSVFSDFYERLEGTPSTSQVFNPYRAPVSTGARTVHVHLDTPRPVPPTPPGSESTGHGHSTSLSVPMPIDWHLANAARYQETITISSPKRPPIRVNQVGIDIEQSEFDI